MFAKNLEGRYIWINSTFEELFGLVGGDIIGKTDREVFEPDQARRFMENDRKVLDLGAPVEFEEWARYLDGEHISIVQKFPLRNERGEVIGIAGIATDITDRKRAEQTLRASERQFRDAFEKSAIGMVVKDLGGTIVQLNSSYCNIVGYSREQLLQTDYSRITHPDDRERNADLMSQLLRGEIPSFVLEKRYVRKDGSIVWVQNSVTLLKDFRGIPDRYIALVEDITERKIAMERLRSLGARLEQVREEERAQIAREVHDELGQMLTALSLGLSALGRNLAKKQKRSAASLLKRIGGMNRIIEQAVQSVRHIAMHLRPDVLDRLGLVEGIRWQAKEVSRRAGIKLQFQGSQIPSSVGKQVSIGLFRIAQEAFTNVARHANASELHVQLTANDGGIVLRIEDNGKGFDESIHRSKSFGLLGMEERARIMSGTLTVQGSPGKGTIIQVEIPQRGLRS